MPKRLLKLSEVLDKLVFPIWTVAEQVNVGSGRFRGLNWNDSFSNLFGFRHANQAKKSETDNRRT